jgi:SAM-dependent methyltransferase
LKNTGHQNVETWDKAYEGIAPWDIPGPQPDLREWIAGESVVGPALDIGCGSGEHAILLAKSGYQVVAIDWSTVAIDMAKAKVDLFNETFDKQYIGDQASSPEELGSVAAALPLNIDFQVMDVMKVNDLKTCFGLVLDCGLFHFFKGQSRDDLLTRLRSVMRSGGRFYSLCFSDDEPGEVGPPRLSKAEIRKAFSRPDWKLIAVEPRRFQTLTGKGFPAFSPGGARAWILTAETR